MKTLSSDFYFSIFPKNYFYLLLHKGLFSLNFKLDRLSITK